MLENTKALLAVSPGLVIAISLGSVFFEAMTYIGNGPNFMVKAIADSTGVRTPSLFGLYLQVFSAGAPAHLLITGWIFL